MSVSMNAILFCLARVFTAPQTVFINPSGQIGIWPQFDFVGDFPKVLPPSRQH